LLLSIKGWHGSLGVAMRSIEFSLIRIPDDLSFDDLNLMIDPDTGTLEFDWGPLRTIVGLNADLSLEAEAAVIELIIAWYGFLRLQGYRHDVAEHYFRDCEAMRQFGAGRVMAGPDTLN